MAAFEVAPAVPADLDALIDIYISNFSTHYFNSIMLPIDRITEPVLRRFLHRRWAKFFAIPDQRIFKVTDTATGTIVAWSRWGLPYTLSEDEKKARKDFEDAEVEEWIQKGEIAKGTKYPVGANAEMATSYFGRFEALRDLHYDPKEDYSLNFLAVSPAYHRRGISKLLLLPMLAQIDAEKKRCYLESTPAGHGVYLGLGWRDLGVVEGEVVRWGVPGGKPYNDWVMIRDPQPVSQSQTQKA